MKIFFKCLLLTTSIFMSKKCEMVCNLDECIIDNIDKDRNIYCEKKFVYLTIFPINRRIIDSTVRFHLNNCTVSEIDLSNINGVEISTQLLGEISSKRILYYFYNSDFNFIYKKDLQALDQNFLVNITEISFVKNNRYRTNISTLMFKDSKIESLIINEMVSTKVVSNYLTFNSEPEMADLNADIKSVAFTLFNINLNGKMLNKQVFKNIQSLRLEDFFIVAEASIFKSFTYLKTLDLRLFSLQKFFHSGTSWIKFLNSNAQNKSQPLFLSLIQNNIYNLKEIIVEDYKFSDQDFCLFKDFPHSSNVILKQSYSYNSCTYQWLTQNGRNFSLFNKTNHNSMDFSDCDINKMKMNCTLTHVSSETTNNTKNTFEFFYLLNDEYYDFKFYDYILSIIVFPLICVSGFVFNLLTIVTLKNKNFTKHFKTRTYQLVSLNSVVNCMICLIYLLRLTIKCIDPISSFCLVPLITNRFFRYSMLTLTNYIGNSLKSFSNLIHIFIILDRYIFHTEKRCTLIMKFSKIDLKLYFMFSSFFCFLINFIRVFQFDYNISYLSYHFPSVFFLYFDFRFAYAYFNLLCVIFIEFVIIAFQFVLILILLIFIKKSINNKKLLIKREIKSKFKDQIEHDLNLIIFFSGSLLIIFQLPDFFASIFTVCTYLLTLGNLINNLIIFQLLLSNLTEIIYFLSFSLDFFIFLFFNKLYRLSFKQVFFP